MQARRLSVQRKFAVTTTALRSFLLRRLRGEILDRETQQFADARVLLLRIPLQLRALLVGDANRDLAMRNRNRHALFEIEFVHRETDHFAGGTQAVPVAKRFDFRDERAGEIERERS